MNSLIIYVRINQILQHSVVLCPSMTRSYVRANFPSLWNPLTQENWFQRRGYQLLNFYREMVNPCSLNIYIRAIYRLFTTSSTTYHHPHGSFQILTWQPWRICFWTSICLRFPFSAPLSLPESVSARLPPTFSASFRIHPQISINDLSELLHFNNMSTDNTGYALIWSITCTELMNKVSVAWQKLLDLVDVKTVVSSEYAALFVSVCTVGFLLCF